MKFVHQLCLLKNLKWLVNQGKQFRMMKPKWECYKYIITKVAACSVVSKCFLVTCNSRSQHFLAKHKHYVLPGIISDSWKINNCLLQFEGYLLLTVNNFCNFVDPNTTVQTNTELLWRKLQALCLDGNCKHHFICHLFEFMIKGPLIIRRDFTIYLLSLVRSPRNREKDHIQLYTQH